MNLFLRFAYIVIRSFFIKRLSPLQESILRFPVLPNDLDTNAHMNNGRYLTIMDLGRIDLILRMGFLKLRRLNNWNPIVAAITIQYKQSMKLFQKYTLRTRILAWDEKWFYIEQRFERKGHIAAIAIVKGLFRGSHHNIPPHQVLKELGSSTASPPIPEFVLSWIKSQDSIRLTP